jgi:hypothetical protein
VPRYLLVPENQVAPDVVAMAREAVRWAAADLELGVTPEIRWFADARELPSDLIAAAREVFVPGDGVPKAGNVPPFVRYSAPTGWDPSPPVILLNRSQCLPDTPLHELRHLWQVKAGAYRANDYASPELEADADAWAANAIARRSA